MTPTTILTVQVIPEGHTEQGNRRNSGKNLMQGAMRLVGWTWEETIHPRGNASFHQNGSLKGVADPPKFSERPFLKKSNVPFR